MSNVSRFSAIAIALLSGAVIACSADVDTTTQPTASPLSGLSTVSRNDSSTTPGQPATGTGYFRGTVMAPATPGSGNDSLKTAPRIANVRVTIYVNTAAAGAPPSAGASVGSVVTDANGYFQLPELPAGEYVVTFEPPAGSVYASVYAFGPLRSNSSSWPWWVVLPRR